MTNIAANSEKGEWGEDFVESSLKKYFNADTDRKKGNEDKGIDIYVHFTHPIHSTRISFGVQVKTGQSHVTDLGDRWKVNINEKKFLKAKESNLPIMIVWVDDSNTTAYWILINTNTTSNHIYVTKNFPLSPLTFYNFLIKLEQISYSKNNNFSNKAMAIKHKRVGVRINDTVKYSKIFYKNRLLGKIINNSIVGDVKITWSAWRAITRHSKRIRFIVSSLEMLATVETVLLYATKIKYYKRNKSILRGNWTFASSIIVLEIDNIIFSDRAPASIRLLVEERIRYHNEYSNPISLRNKKYMNRELVFENIFEIIKK